jgi:tRNA nucleotidyltransferase (CCA-adding enzyme)
VANEVDAAGAVVGPTSGLPDHGLRHPAAGLVQLSDAAGAVLETIRSAGGRPYLVGGCVRDALLAPGHRPKDVDIEVFGLELDRVVFALTRVGRVDEVGRSFAVLKVRREGQDFDVAVPQTRRGTDPGAAPAVDNRILPEVAARRRDYTINALMFDPTTEVVLDFVDGLADLRAGALRHSGPAFVEDPLRVLRGAQFAARFGLRLAPETAEVCRRLALAYADLPAERIWGEWRKIAEQGRYISAALAVLAESGWLAHFPQLARLAGVPQDPRWHPEGDVLTHSGLAADAAAALADEAGLTGDDRTVVVLCALLHDVGKAEHTQVRADGRITSYGHAEGGVAPLEELLASIGAPSTVISRIVPVVREHMTATSAGGTPSSAAVRRLARRLAPATMTEWSLVCGADHAGRGSGSGPNPTTSWLTVAEAAGVDRRPSKLLLRGDDVIALGHAPGPQYRPVMEAALAAQDEGLFTDHAGAVVWLARIAADGRLARYLSEGG